MQIEKLVTGIYQENCYLVSENDQLIVIDPGDGFSAIVRHISSHENIRVAAILLTHGHFDHIGAVDRLVRKYGCPVYACEEEEPLLRNEKYNTDGFLKASLSCDIKWLSGQWLDIGPFHIRILYTPGHTRGSVMYLIENSLFSGDTLFKLSIGRTDLYGGSLNQELASLEQLRSLDENTVVYPGHEDNTTVGYELANNPYLN